MRERVYDHEQMDFVVVDQNSAGTTTNAEPIQGTSGLIFLIIMTAVLLIAVVGLAMRYLAHKIHARRGGRHNTRRKMEMVILGLIASTILIGTEILIMSLLT